MIEIKPLARCAAEITIPGSKSYTHRALIVAALAAGTSFLSNALKSEDTLYTAQGLEKMGIKIIWERGGVRVAGKGGVFKKGEEKIYLGNSGTSMRFLTALAALREGRTYLDGSERMRERPMGELIRALRTLKIKAYALKNDGCPPIVVESQGLAGGQVTLKGSQSSQFLSALFLISPYSQRDMAIEVDGPLASKPYLDMTREVMSAFGVEVEGDFPSFLIRSGQRYLPQNYLIDGDASNASYFWAAAAITKGRVRVDNLRPYSAQGDLKFLDLLKRMGCQVIHREKGIEVQGGPLQAIEADMNSMPDVVPTLAVVAAFAAGETTIYNIGHLRFKESDRLKAVATELNKIGIKVEEGQDWLKITGGQPHGAEIETYQDHRIAMSFAIAGLAVPGVRIKGEDCVSKSFPSFWETLQQLY
ncbi:MAG: 3-phosphoshikimate 1-carboxyvinyltransferase [Thermodesulfobacteriota bacterium]